MRAEAAANDSLSNSRDLAESVKVAVDKVVATSSEQAADGSETAREAMESSRFVLILMMVLNVTCSLLVGWFLISRQVVRRLVGLASGMGEVATGNLKIDIDANGRDEITDMAKALVVFRDNASEMERMRAEQEEMEKRSVEERRQAMNEMANRFEESVQGIVDQLPVFGQEHGRQLGFHELRRRQDQGGLRHRPHHGRRRRRRAFRPSRPRPIS